MSTESIDMDTVFEAGLKLPDVQESQYYGARALKLHGRMMACMPVNKSAEPNSVAVAMGMERRAALLKKSPSIYYITDHYAPYPTLLIRLSRISCDELEKTLHAAWEFASTERAGLSSSGKAKRRTSLAPSGR